MGPALIHIHLNHVLRNQNGPSNEKDSLFTPNFRRKKKHIKVHRHQHFFVVECRCLTLIPVGVGRGSTHNTYINTPKRV